MAVNADAIEAGSIEHGQRENTEGLLEGLGGGEDAPTGGAPGTPTDAAGGVGDPLGSLLAGGVVPQSGEPLTSGLEVGDGFSPSEGAGEIPDEYTERLRVIAQYSASPVLRLLASEMLMKRTRSARRVRARQ